MAGRAELGVGIIALMLYGAVGVSPDLATCVFAGLKCQSSLPNQ
jgi:hypothetical protein